MFQNWLKKRFSEPSSWAGLATVLASVGIITQVQAFALGEIIRVAVDNWPAVASLFAGAAAVALPESKAQGEQRAE